MRAGRAFRAAVIARLASEVSGLSGKVFDKAVSGTSHPYATLGASDFGDRSPTCLTLRPYALQVDVWGRDTSKGALEDLVDDVTTALVGWSPAPIVAAHPLRLELVRIMDDPDGESVHGIIQVSTMIEGV